MKNRILKGFLCTLLSAGMLLDSGAVTALASQVESTEAAENAETAENQSADNQSGTSDDDALPSSHCTGYEESMEDYVPDTVSRTAKTSSTDGIYADTSSQNANGASVTDSSYRNTNLTSIKNQNTGGWNLCWAFSTIACAEADLIQNSDFDKDTTDLSEIQLAYFVANPVQDPLKFMSKTELFNRDFNDGGNYDYSTSAIAQGMCLTDESVAPIDTATDSTKLSAAKAYLGQYSLDNAYFISYKDATTIKKAILNYGAVGISYNCFTGSLTADGDGCYKYYYCPYSAIVNHAVTIVGWDDTISASNFVYTNSSTGETQSPSKDGAWIVRNSWGTDWGEDGYFYMSYEEGTLDSYLVAYDVQKDPISDNTYQYDFNDGYYYNPDDNDDIYTSMNQQLYTCANVFETQANAGGYETLEAVSFFTYKGNSDYTVKVYTGLTDDTNPESGTLEATLTGTIDAAGYYTLDLETPIILTEGEKYSVEVSTVKTGTDTVLGVACEMGRSSYCEEGQSFFYWDDIDQWTDMVDWGGANARIKAFTNNCSYSEEPTAMSFGESAYTVPAVGAQKKTFINFTPKNSTGDITYTSANTSIATVDSKGVLTGVGVGTTTITATCGSLTASCKVTVKKGLNIQATSTADAITYSWNALSGATQYDLTLEFFGNDADNQYKYSAQDYVVDKSVTSYTVDVDLIGVYKLNVSSQLSDGTIWESKEVISLLPSVGNLTTTFINKNSIGISWDSNSLASQYFIYLYDEEKGDWEIIGNTTGTTYVVKDLEAATTYKIGVGYRFRDTGGKTHDADLSNAVTATTISSGIGTIGVTQNSASCEIDVTWTAFENAKSYTLMQMSELSDYEWEIVASYTEADATDDVYQVTLTEDENAIQSGYTYYYKLYVYSDETTRDDTTYLGRTSVSKVTYVNEASAALLDLGLSTQNGVHGLEISWKADEDDTAKSHTYTLYRVDLETDTRTVLTSGQTGAISYTYVDKTAVSGTSYYYQVEEYNGKAYVGKTKTIAQKFVGCPNIANLENVSGGVKITWAKVTGADHYQIYRRVNNSGSFSLVKEICGGSITSYVDTKATAFKKNSYYVIALNGSDQSSQSKGFLITYVPEVAKPTVTNTANGIQISWKKVSGISKYRVYFSTNGIDSWCDLSDTSYVVTSTKNGGTCKIKVVGLSGNDEGYGTEVTFVRLTAPTLSSVKNSASKKMTVTWKKNSSAGGYQIQYATAKSFSGAKSVTVSGASSVSKAISGLTKGKTYYVRVRAYKKVGSTTYYSGWSSTKSLKISK